MSKKSIIADFIKNHPGTEPKEIISSFNSNASGVFRHLKKLQEQGIIYKMGKTPKVRYFAFSSNMDNLNKNVTRGLNWEISGDPKLATPEELCPTRDVFDARQYRLFNDLKFLKDQNLIALLAAVAGEIGNNSFDHNIGRWRDVPGIFFTLDESTRTIVLADRGQGVKDTLQRVRPEITDDQNALRVAFTEMVSGRAPEKRGNGLKLVKKVVAERQLYLEYYTGHAMATLTGQKFEIKESKTFIPGTFAILTF